MEQHACQHEDCCKSRNGACGGCHAAPVFSAKEKEFLHLLSQAPFLPIGRFLLKSRRSAHLEAVALAPVYLTTRQDSIEAVRENAAALKRLEACGTVTLDYDMPLENGDYAVFRESEVYQSLQAAVQEGQEKPGFIFDTAELECGSLALTGVGQEALEAIE